MDMGNLQTPPGNYRLESWNGVYWEIGHPEHWNLTNDKWLEIRPMVRKWSSKWRLLKITQKEGSK